MRDSLFDLEYPEKGSEERKSLLKQHRYVTNEQEPVFDAADILRCGRDIFMQHSFTTNMFGMRWLQQHLGPGFKVHPVHFPDDQAPVHIDATFVVPLITLSNSY
jgi:glycine amidinotransferase